MSYQIRNDKKEILRLPSCRAPKYLMGTLFVTYEADVEGQSRHLEEHG